MNPNIYFKYCRIQRAAEILNCKTDDILHYASLGLIDLCLMVSELSAYLFLYGGDEKEAEKWFRYRWRTYGHCDIGRQVMLTDYSSFRFHLEFDEDDYMADFMRKIDNNAFVVNKSQETWYPEKGREDHFTTYTTNYGKINGLWVIDKNTCLNLFIHGSAKLSSASFSPADPDDDCIVQQAICEDLCMNECDEICMCENTSFNYTVTSDDLWITFEQFQAIKEIDIFDIQSSVPVPDEKESESQSDARGLHWAEKRGEVKLVATLTMKDFPEQCGTTNEQWADTIIDKAPLYWRDKGMPPLTRKSILGIISKLKKEQPHLQPS